MSTTQLSYDLVYLPPAEAADWRQMRSFRIIAWKVGKVFSFSSESLISSGTFAETVQNMTWLELCGKFLIRMPDTLPPGDYTLDIYEGDKTQITAQMRPEQSFFLRWHGKSGRVGTPSKDLVSRRTG